MKQRNVLRLGVCACTCTGSVDVTDSATEARSCHVGIFVEDSSIDNELRSGGRRIRLLDLSMVKSWWVWVI